MKRKIQVRNPVARAVRNPQGPFNKRVEQDRTKYTRKQKHKKEVDKL
jgi:hypothetical protein